MESNKGFFRGKPCVPTFWGPKNHAQETGETFNPSEGPFADS